MLGLKAITEPHHAILCANSAHIYRDECGAPERFTGCKLNPVEAPNGKIEIESLKPWLADKGSEHHNQPPSALHHAVDRARYGVPPPRRLPSLSEFCRQHELYLHVDGARLANAAASLGVGLRAITTDVGVDVVTLGGTKNGILGGESSLVLERAPRERFQMAAETSHAAAVQIALLVAAQFLALFHERALAAERFAFERDGKASCRWVNRREGPRRIPRGRATASSRIFVRTRSKNFNDKPTSTSGMRLKRWSPTARC